MVNPLTSQMYRTSSWFHPKFFACPAQDNEIASRNAASRFVNSIRAELSFPYSVLAFRVTPSGDCQLYKGRCFLCLVLAQLSLSWLFRGLVIRVIEIRYFISKCFQDLLHGLRCNDPPGDMQVFCLQPTFNGTEADTEIVCEFAFVSWKWCGHRKSCFIVESNSGNQST